MKQMEEGRKKYSLKLFQRCLTGLEITYWSLGEMMLLIRVFAMTAY